MLFYYLASSYISLLFNHIDVPNFLSYKNIKMLYEKHMSFTL